MYGDAFCKIYNELGWNYFPEAFGEQLLRWLRQNGITPSSSLDLGCGTGVLCEILHEQGIEAAGMDFSESMIAIARGRNPHIAYDVADMVTYRPDRQFDLVTCTGDALNHIMSLADVEQIFANVHGYLSEGGHFIFDILNEQEVPTEEPIDLDDSQDGLHTRLVITRDAEGVIHLRATATENGEIRFEEDIREILHDPDTICALLEKRGFRVLRCAHQLLDGDGQQGTTWFIIAQKV